jgi:magnesium-transporting ATPase (P-type)
VGFIIFISAIKLSTNETETPYLTVPADYEEFLNYYTRHGYRVIAVAAKSFPKLSWIKAQRLTRSQVESELRFIGFVIFENKLKLATEPAIQLLKSAHIGVRMCTGDNIRTAISVGRDCGMIEDSMRVYLPTFTSGTDLFITSTSTKRPAHTQLLVFRRLINSCRFNYRMVRHRQ